MEPTKDTNLITGIHHVTAISGDAQQNIDFYTGVLGLKLVKQTVNFDYPEVYHFYFGDNTGAPGSIMTTFPYGAKLTKGRHGKGKINTTAFSLPYHAVDYWVRRLEHFDLLFKHPQERFGGNEVVIYLEDPDGMGVELIFNESDKRPPISTGAVSDEYAIQGIHHVELWLESFERTAALLTERMNHTLIAERSGRLRYGVEDTPGKFIDLLWIPETLRGLDGRGMVHHVAFSISGNRVAFCSRSLPPSRASRSMRNRNIWENRCNYLLNSKRRGNSSTSRSPLFSITHPNSC